MMRLHLLLSRPLRFFALAAMLAISAAAQTVIVEVGLDSEDLFRGISFVDGMTADLSVGIETDRGFFAGIIASAVLEEAKDREIDYYLGWFWQRDSRTSWSLTLYQYTFSGEASTFDFSELDLVLERPRWTAEVAFSPNLYGTDARSFYTAFSRPIPLPKKLTLTPYAGIYLLQDAERAFYPGAPGDYLHYGLDLSWWMKDVSVSIGWSGTNSDAGLLFGEGSAGDRLVVSIRYQARFRDHFGPRRSRNSSSLR